MPFPRAHLTWVAVAFTFWAWGYHFVLETCFIIHQLYLLRGCNYLFLFKWNLESKRINVLSDILFYVMLVFEARLLTLHSSTLVFSRTLSSPAYSHSTLYIPIQSSKPQFRHTLSVQPFFFSIFNSPRSFPPPHRKDHSLSRTHFCSYAHSFTCLPCRTGGALSIFPFGGSPASSISSSTQ